jgi:hypothetical protein
MPAWLRKKVWSAPCPVRLMDLLIESTELQVESPAGITTVSPFLADAIAAATSFRAVLAAVISAAPHIEVLRQAASIAAPNFAPTFNIP